MKKAQSTATAVAPQKPAPQKSTPLEGPIKPEMFPADLGGGDIHFLKRGEYAKRTAETFALKHKADIKKDHVTQILEALDKGQTEIAGDNPEEFVKLFALVREDYEAAVEKVVEDARAAAEAKEKKEQEEKEAKEKEEKLFLAIKDKNPNLGNLADKFDTGNMDRFIAKKDVTDEDLLGALNTGLRMSEFTGWMIGDLVVELEKRGQLNVVKRLSEESGTAYSKVYNDCKTAKKFPPEKRVSGVSFTVFREVANAKFTPDQEKKAVPALVNEVAEGKHTTQSVREAVRKVQGKTNETTTTAPEDSDKFRFLVFDASLEEDKQIQIAVGFPKELFANGAVVINPKTMSSFQGFTKKNRWVELETYEAPAPEPEPTPAKPLKKK